MESSNLRIVFFGTSDFAVASLDLLLKNNINIVGVVTVPDKPAGRGQKLHISLVKKFAIDNNLFLLQPEKLKAPDFIDTLRNLKADLQIIIAFRILPEIVWSMPPLGTFNLHASLLPQYRGAAPINWAIINGEKETGNTTFFLNNDIDTGKIILQEKTQIADEETACELHDKLKISGAHLVLRTIKLIEENKNNSIEQAVFIDKSVVLKPAPKINKEDCRINWNNSADNIYNFIRGLSPLPCAFTELASPDNNIFYFKIYKASKETLMLQENKSNATFMSQQDKSKATLMSLYMPGKVLTDGKTYLAVSAIDELIYINEIQLTGKKRLPIYEFLRGFRIDDGWNVC